ncbi:MAG: hypothetical protein L0216_07290 [Planctomycetales bacterium]|nr:hypothetical protein [Planctomycetales bacterium]
MFDTLLSGWRTEALVRAIQAVRVGGEEAAKKRLSHMTPSAQAYLAVRLETAGDDGLGHALDLLDALEALGFERAQFPAPGASDAVLVQGTLEGRGAFAAEIPPRILRLRGTELRRALATWFGLLASGEPAPARPPILGKPPGIPVSARRGDTTRPWQFAPG